MEDWRPNWAFESEYEHLNNASWMQFAWEFLRRNDKYQADWSSLKNKNSVSHESRALAKKWCLIEMRDPARKGADGFWLKNRSVRKLTLSRKRSNIDFLDWKIKQKVGFGFDLNQELDPQINAAREELLAQQQLLQSEGKLTVEWVGNNLGDLILYLRILDARKAQASHNEIVATIDRYVALSAEGKVDAHERLKENLKSSRRFMKKDYPKLLLRP